jgi:two-component sensor histidine kinase
MASLTTAVAPRGLARIFAWPRVRFTLAISALVGFLLSLPNETAMIIVIARVAFVGLVALLAFGVFERWPKQPPRWLARSALQVIAVAVIVPPSAAMAYHFTTDHSRMNDQAEQRKLFAGFATLTVAGLFLAPWIAVGALLRQRDDFAREQALAFELERSKLERNALDARLRLLQAQVEPHFLFNTLANVQALVDAGSPHASKVLASLVAYLRAAVPRMHESATTLGQELQLVQAYLELMQMRMPDRLQFELRIDPAANPQQCPPMTLLTLVENAVRHGIDPSEEGGRIEIDVRVHEGRCRISVVDTGVGFKPTSSGLGTGLSTLRERLQLTFGNDARLHLIEVEPHGVRAELDFPAR